MRSTRGQPRPGSTPTVSATATSTATATATATATRSALAERAFPASRIVLRQVESLCPAKLPSC